MPGLAKWKGDLWDLEEIDLRFSLIQVEQEQTWMTLQGGIADKSNKKSGIDRGPVQEQCFFLFNFREMGSSSGIITTCTSLQKGEGIGLH